MLPALRDAFMLDEPRLLKSRVCAPPRVSNALLLRPLKSRLPPLVLLNPLRSAAPARLPPGTSRYETCPLWIC